MSTYVQFRKKEMFFYNYILILIRTQLEIILIYYIFLSRNRRYNFNSNFKVLPYKRDGYKQTNLVVLKHIVCCIIPVTGLWCKLWLLRQSFITLQFGDFLVFCLCKKVYELKIKFKFLVFVLFNLTFFQNFRKFSQNYLSCSFHLKI